MGGLQRLFLKITPIIMLICFICFGITHAFQEERQPNITYLTHETIEVIADNPVTEQNEQVTIENYNFDFQSYRDNIDIDILKRATTNVIDVKSYKDTLDEFNNIWEDGYQFGDGIQTIVNAVILVINTLIMPINIIIAPVRVIAGILLTGISLVGIDINRNTAIITSLNAILDNLAIPLINPTFNKDDIRNMTGEVWRFNNNMYGDYAVYEFEFTANNTTYTAIRQNRTNNTNTVEYRSQNNEWIQVYNAYWLSSNYKTITILNMPDDTDEKAQIYKYLRGRAEQLQVEGLNNTTWYFNNQINYTGNITLNFTFESNNTQYNSLYFSRTTIQYGTTYVYNTYGGISAWSNAEYQTIYIESTNGMTTEQIALLTELLQNNATQIQ